jgi:hypothetical protein
MYGKLRNHISLHPPWLLLLLLLLLEKKETKRRSSSSFLMHTRHYFFITATTSKAARQRRMIKYHLYIMLACYISLCSLGERLGRSGINLIKFSKNLKLCLAFVSLFRLVLLISLALSSSHKFVLAELGSSQ